MKYVIVLGDGMADEPIEAIGGMTPLEYAKTPEMDRLAKMSELGMVQTIPEGMSPGSDTANLRHRWRCAIWCRTGSPSSPNPSTKNEWQKI